MLEETNHYLCEAARSTNPVPAPFIVGVGRSGTTLLRIMLDAHPDLAIPAETHFLPFLLRLQGDAQTSPLAFLEAIRSQPNWEDFHLPVDEFRRSLLATQPFDPAAGLRCFYQAYARRFHKRRWGDKTPAYQNHMRVITQHFDEAYFIHMIRDGRDVAASGRCLWFGPGNDIAAQAANWKKRILRTRTQAAHVAHYLEIRYENLILHTDEVLQQVCNFISLPYDDAMRNYHTNALSRHEELLDRRYPRIGSVVPKERRRKVHARTSRQPDPTRVQRWKRDLCREEVRLFEKVAGDMLRELGYDT